MISIGRRISNAIFVVKSRTKISKTCIDAPIPKHLNFLDETLTMISRSKFFLQYRIIPRGIYLTFKRTIALKSVKIKICLFEYLHSKKQPKLLKNTNSWKHYVESWKLSTRLFIWSFGYKKFFSNSKMIELKFWRRIIFWKPIGTWLVVSGNMIFIFSCVQKIGSKSLKWYSNKMLKNC